MTCGEAADVIRRNHLEGRVLYGRRQGKPFLLEGMGIERGVVDYRTVKCISRRYRYGADLYGFPEEWELRVDDRPVRRVTYEHGMVILEEE